MQHLHGFVDDFGNARLNLEKDGTFSQFVLNSVLIKEAKLEQVHKLRKSISQRYFQGHPLKSSLFTIPFLTIEAISCATETYTTF